MIDKLQEIEMHKAYVVGCKINEIIDWINYWEGRERNKNKAMPSDKSPVIKDTEGSPFPQSNLCKCSHRKVLHDAQWDLCYAEGRSCPCQEFRRSDLK